MLGWVVICRLEMSSWPESLASTRMITLPFGRTEALSGWTDSGAATVVVVVVGGIVGLGIWAFGLLLYTIFVRITIPVLSGQLTSDGNGAAVPAATASAGPA